MANRTRRFGVGSPEAGHDILVISWVAGGAGAVGALAPSTRAKGFRKTTPVALVSGGTYDVFLEEKWVDLMWYVANCNGPLSATTGKEAQVISDTLTGATPSVRLAFTRLDTGAEAAPASGDQVYVTLALKRRAPL